MHINYMEQSPYQKATGFSTGQEMPALYGIWRLITMFTAASNVSLSWRRWIQCVPSCLVSPGFILILSPHICSGVQRGLFPLGFPTKVLYTFLVSSHMHRQSHPPWTEDPNIWWRVQLMKLLIPAMVRSVTSQKTPDFENEHIPKFILQLSYCVVLWYIGTEPHNAIFLVVVAVCNFFFSIANVP